MAEEAVKFKVGDVAKNERGERVRIVYDDSEEKTSPWPLLGVILDGLRDGVTGWYSENGAPSGAQNSGRLIGLHREPRELLLQRVPSVFEDESGAWVSVSERNARDAGSEVIRVREVIE